MGYLVRGSDGSVFTGTNPSVIRPTSIGKLSRMVGFSLENAAPGDYDIVMSFKDELAGKTLELHEPFTVSARLPQAAPAPTGGQ